MAGSTVRIGVVFALLLVGATPALAQGCQGPEAFPGWLESFKARAVQQGVSPGTAASALSGLTYSSKVISLDRSQKAFRQSFEQFAASRITSGRLGRGAQLLRSYASLLQSLESRYGVPGPVLIAIWGLETDFGANTGNMPSLRSLATLAFDCRRQQMFEAELIAALMIIDRGDLTPAGMRGAWAGELGQTQFLATNYLRFAVDGDGDGRRDLIRSPTDALASTANYLAQYGWRRGAGWEPGQPNFAVIKQWNRADVYARTIALFASKLAGG